MPPETQNKPVNMQAKFPNATPILTHKEALEKSLKLEAEFRAKQAAEGESTNSRPSVLDDDPERVALLDSYLQEYIKQIQDCTFPLKEEQEYILRFRQVANVILHKMELQILPQKRTPADLAASFQEWVTLTAKLEAMNDTAAKHPEMKTVAFEAEREGVIRDLKRNDAPPRAKPDAGVQKILDGKVKEKLSRVVEPTVKSAMGRNGEERSERVRWDELREMVERLCKEISSVLDWEYWLDGIPEWYKPMWFEDEFLRS